jgi:hypothetical protein
LCDPLTVGLVAGGASQAGQQVIGYLQQSRDARAQNRFQRQEFETTKRLAEDAAERQYTAIRRRQVEAAGLRAREVEQVTREALVSAGLARVSGAAGSSVAAVFRDVAAQSARFRDDATRRAMFEDLQSDDEARATRAELHGRVLAARPVPVARPSFLNLALGLTGTAAGTFSDVASAKKT